MSVGRFLQQGAAGNADTGDDDFANVVLLLDGDGTSGDNNETFTDSSTNGFTVTETGSVVQGSFSPYGDNWSNSFDGSSSLSVTNLTAPGTTFTVEFWVYFNDPNDDGLFQFTDTLGATSTTDRPGLFVDSAGQLKAYANGGNRGTGTTLVAGQWYHIAMVRASSTVNVYVDGTSVWNASETEDFSAHNDLNIGKLYSTGYLLNGYLSNFRYVSGTAVYTANFTPPTAPLTAITNTELLTCQSNRFIDNSSNSYTVAVQAGTPKVTPFSPFKDSNARTLTTDGGSGYFDGSSYLSVPNSTDFDFGTGDFTWEAWIRTTDSSSQYISIVASYDNTNTNAWGLHVSYGNFLAFLSGTTIFTGSITVSDGAWHHVACTRSGTTVRLFVDGVLDTSSTSSVSALTNNEIRIGSLNSSQTRYFTGDISNVRIIKGTAVYTSAFTPPTAPLTAVTNTELLLNFQDAGIYDRSGITNLDTVGNAQIDTAVKKYGTGSMEFDGTGDYLLCNSSEAFGYSTGDFTLEFWIYKNANPSADAGIIEQRPASTNGNYPMLGLNSSGQLFYYVNAAYKISASASTALSNQAWDHVAYVRSGGNLGTLYINGTSVGTWVDTTDYVSETPLRVGEHAFSAAQFNGYIDDLRITKGVARYTANFTPPTDALPKF